MHPGRVEPPQEVERPLPRRVVLTGEADDHVCVDGGSGHRQANPRHQRGIRGGVVPAPHPAQDGVVARLEWDVEVGQASSA